MEKWVVMKKQVANKQDAGPQDAGREQPSYDGKCGTGEKRRQEPGDREERRRYDRGVAEYARNRVRLLP